MDFNYEPTKFTVVAGGYDSAADGLDELLSESFTGGADHSPTKSVVFGNFENNGHSASTVSADLRRIFGGTDDYTIAKIIDSSPENNPNQELDDLLLKVEQGLELEEGTDVTEYLV